MGAFHSDRACKHTKCCCSTLLCTCVRVFFFFLQYEKKLCFDLLSAIGHFATENGKWKMKRSKPMNYMTICITNGQTEHESSLYAPELYTMHTQLFIWSFNLNKWPEIKCFKSSMLITFVSLENKLMVCHSLHSIRIRFEFLYTRSL